jgi:hypothetical protein
VDNLGPACAWDEAVDHVDVRSLGSENREDEVSIERGEET